MKKSSNYVDISAVNQVIGNIYNNPQLLSMNDKYFFNEDDCPSGFTRIVFNSIYNLYQQGAQKITLEAIEDYLAPRPKLLAEYHTNNGPDYISACSENAQREAFDYYYHRLKKFSLLRAFDNLGIDVTEFYDPNNILDVKKKQAQEDRLDNKTLEEIAKSIQSKIDTIADKYIHDSESLMTHQAGEGIEELLESLKESPSFGFPLPGKYINAIHRGARTGCFYIRSAPTGLGKSRSMVADMCYIGCSQIWSFETNKWISTGACQPSLYIATEQSIEEVQTMALAYISGVNEEHILTNSYYSGEQERVAKAVQILKSSKLRFETIPDFSIKDIEILIKRGIREYNCRYIGFDYLHTSMAILSEVSSRSGGVKIREDSVLTLFSIKLKELAVKYDVFIESATQLSGDFRNNETPDQTLLRGARAIADKIDYGSILLEVTEKDKEAIAPIVKKLGCEMPDTKLSIYKNRAGKVRGDYLWLHTNKACCRFEGAFFTSWSYIYQEVPDIKITVEDESGF